MWIQSRYALEFFTKYKIPFQDMVNANSRVTNNNWCLVERSSGRVIVVYLRKGGTATINLGWLRTDGVPRTSLQMSVHWYNPRRGGELQVGTVATVKLPVDNTAQELGNAPNGSNIVDDWVVLLQCLKDC